MRSQHYLHSVEGHLDAFVLERPALRGILVENGIGVVDMDQNPARARELAQSLDHSPGSRLRQVSDLSRPLASDPKADHFFICPEGTVYEEAVDADHRAAYPLVEIAESRRIEGPTFRFPVADEGPDVVAGLRPIPPRGEWRGFARQGQRPPLDSIDAFDREPLSIDSDRMPIDPAEMIEQAQDRKTCL